MIWKMSCLCESSLHQVLKDVWPFRNVGQALRFGCCFVCGCHNILIWFFFSFYIVRYWLARTAVKKSHRLDGLTIEIYCLIVLKARNQGVGKFGYFEVCEEKMSARLLALICRRWFCGVLHIRMFVSNFPFLFDQGSYYTRAPSSSS